MHLSPTTARLLVATAFPIEEVALRPGAEVVARVVWVAPGGHGLLALAGAHVHAKLPPGLLEGQKLPLTVVGANAGGEVVLRMRSERREAVGATERDGEVVRSAEVPVGVSLPGGAVAELRIDPDEEHDHRGQAGRQAAIVLHSPALGPIEVGLRLDPGGVRARVTVEPGEALQRAEAASDELVDALARATERPALVDVAARAPDASRPRRPAQEPFDAYA